jgi:hypothetical protein
VGSWGTTKFLPTEDTSAIVLEAKGEGTGNAVRKERPIRVVRGASPPAIVFRADRAQVPVGESVTLRVVRPQRTTRYTLKAEGPGGASTRDVTVSVTPGPGPACGPI